MENKALVVPGPYFIFTTLLVKRKAIVNGFSLINCPQHLAFIFIHDLYGITGEISVRQKVFYSPIREGLVL
jgi:hypothetical protein